VLDTGVTFSGGEPFAQADALADLAQMLRPRYDIACYTGYLFEALLSRAGREEGVKRLLENIDILVDGPFVEARKDRLLLFRGSANQRILDVPASLAAGAAVWTSNPEWVGEDGSARVL
jgi:anaerobic ribonucleoside-triphosphate reductase activating protein